MLELRSAGCDDLPFLQTMLVEAAHWRPGDERLSLQRTLEDPELARYLEGWGRPRDFGVVAEEEAEPIGAAWGRYFIAEAPGFGFVDETVPELSVAVKAGRRGRGVGTALVDALLEDARERGIASASLSVERDNPALALYERLGFHRVSPTGNAWTMLMALEPSEGFNQS